MEDGEGPAPWGDGPADPVGHGAPAPTRSGLGWMGQAQVAGAVLVAAALVQTAFECLASLATRHAISGTRIALHLLDSVPQIGALPSLIVLVGLVPLLLPRLSEGPQLSARRQRQLLLLGLVATGLVAGLQFLRVINLDADPTGAGTLSDEIRWANRLTQLSEIGPLVVSAVVIALVTRHLTHGRDPVPATERTPPDRAAVVATLAGVALSATFLIGLAVVAQASPSREFSTFPTRNPDIGTPRPVPCGPRRLCPPPSVPNVTPAP